MRTTELLTAQSDLVEGSVVWRTRSRLIVSPRVNAESLVRGEDKEVLASGWAWGDGYVVASSSPDIFSNRSMLDPHLAELAVRLIERADTQAVIEKQWVSYEMVIDETLNASDAYRYSGILFSPALRSGTLQLIMVAILCAWFGFHRFGPARIVRSSHRKSLTTSAEAVGNLQYHAPDGGQVVKDYLEYIESQLRRIYGHAVRLDQYDIIASRSGMPQQQVQQYLQEAHRLTQSPRVNAAHAAKMVRWLAHLRQQLFRAGAGN